MYRKIRCDRECFIAINPLSHSKQSNQAQQRSAAACFFFSSSPIVRIKPAL